MNDPREARADTEHRKIPADRLVGIFDRPSIIQILGRFASGDLTAVPQIDGLVEIDDAGLLPLDLSDLLAKALEVGMHVLVGKHGDDAFDLWVGLEARLPLDAISPPPDRAAGTIGKVDP